MLLCSVRCLVRQNILHTRDWSSQGQSGRCLPGSVDTPAFTQAALPQQIEELKSRLALLEHENAQASAAKQARATAPMPQLVKPSKQAKQAKSGLPPNPLQSELSPKSAKSTAQEDLLSQKDSLTQRVQALNAEVKHLETDSKKTQKLSPLGADDFADLEREVKEVGCRSGDSGFGFFRSCLARSLLSAPRSTR